MSDTEARVWKILQMQLPVDGMTPPSTANVTVRTDGNIAQIKEDRVIPNPLNKDVIAYIEEITEAASGLVDAEISLFNGHDDYESEVIVSGWRATTEQEAAAINK